MNSSTPAKDMRKGLRIAIVLLMFLTLFIVNAAAAEAAIGDKFRDAWRTMSPFVLSGAFWVNALIVSLVLIVGFILIWSRNSSTGAKQTILYIALGVIGILIATKFVGMNGEPQYLWENEQISAMIEFTIGPSDALSCPRSDRCCGSGAYIKEQPQPDCKQAILKTNTGGRGLPAFLFASILFTLLLFTFKSDLNFDKMGSTLGTWFPIGLGVLLGALTANEGVTKGAVLMIGGWTAVILIGRSLSKNFGSESDRGATTKAFGFALSYAFVELLLNMLGASLIGRNPSSSISLFTVIFNLLIGGFVGIVFSTITGQGVFANVGKAAGRTVMNKMKSLIQSGAWREIGQLMTSGLPRREILKQAFEKFLLAKTQDQKIREKIERYQLAYDKLMEKAVSDPNKFDKDAARAIERELENLRRQLRELARENEERYDRNDRYDYAWGWR
ncbi:hypothetical protein KY362_07035 [Candidatus Woesearchaeota archaeon]|nr:hypothetical protein [Candidatus Woesearchaeota archaeon]